MKMFVLVHHRKNRIVIQSHLSRCSPESWITKSLFRKPLSSARIYVCALYYVTSIMSGIGLGGFTPATMGEIWQTIIMGFIGFLFFIFVNSSLISVSLHRNHELIAYQEAMRDLVKFMSYR